MKQQDDFCECMDEEEMTEMDVRSIGITFLTLASVLVLVVVAVILF